MTDKMRSAFEEWAVSRGMSIQRYERSYSEVESMTAWFAWQACAARTVPEGWRIDRCSDGSINVIKDGQGGANVEQNAEQARHIPEEVLWMLANDLLSAAPEVTK